MEEKDFSGMIGKILEKSGMIGMILVFLICISLGEEKWRKGKK